MYKLWKAIHIEMSLKGFPSLYREKESIVDFPFSENVCDVKTNVIR